MNSLIDLANGKNRELERAREVAFEVIADHESTIHKFRDLVNKVQDQNAELRSALEKKKPDATSAMEMIDFKKMLADTKAFSKAIDMELRQCEIDQANLQVRYLNSYMSDSFMARGGDNEAILVILLVPRYNIYIFITFYLFICLTFLFIWYIYLLSQTY